VSSLTEQERRGLEEVFLSISKNEGTSRRKSVYSHLKTMVLLQELKIRSGLKKLKKGMKLLQITHIAHKKKKKKKNLS